MRHNHDSLPTHRFCLANLSCVLSSKRQEIAMPSMTSRKSATHRPEREAWVILVNILD